MIPPKVSTSQALAAKTPTTASGPESILTGEQVAKRLQLKTSTVYEFTRRRNKRPLPVLRAGKFLRFYWSDVEKWLKGNAA